MSTKLTHFLLISLTLISFGIGLYFYPDLPAEIATHWGVSGQPNDYTSKDWGTFILPLILLAIYIMYLLIPVLEPMRKNLDEFRREFNNLILLIALFLGYVYALMLVFNLGYIFDMTLAVIPAIGILIFYIGVLLRSARRNWFIGIRTPWTLSSDTVWNKTHHLASPLFKVSGLVAILSVFWPTHAIWLTLAPVLSSCIFLIIYSFVIFKRLK